MGMRKGEGAAPLGMADCARSCETPVGNALRGVPHGGRSSSSWNAAEGVPYSRDKRARIVQCCLLAALLSAAGCQRPAGSETDTPTAPQIPPTIRTKGGVDMALVQAGEFVMGDEKGEDDEKPAHRVEVSAFYINDPLNYWFFKIWCSSVLSKIRRFFSSDFAA